MGGFWWADLYERILVVKILCGRILVRKFVWRFLVVEFVWRFHDID